MADFNPFLAAGLGAGTAGLGAMFGGNNNPADAAMPWLSQIPDSIKQYLLPYINGGAGAMGDLTKQYGDITSDPGGMLNKIGAGYHQSPGFQFALQQALQGSNHAAAAGGMAGSPQHEQQNMGLATNMADQDYNRWLGQATGMYGMGLQGEQGMAGMGLQAGTSMADQIAQMLAAKAQLGYAGQANQNQSNGAMWGDLGAGAAALAQFGGWL